MKKRWFKTVTAIVMAGALLAGCGTSGNSSSTAAADGETQAEAAEGTKTYTMFMRGTFVDWISELKWYDEAEKRTGVHVEYVKGPDSQEDAFAEVDQRLISGTLTDATFCRQAQANVYGAQGAFRDLAPLIKEYAPNIQKYLDENPEYAALVTNEDGTIYGLLNETPRLANFCFYRALTSVTAKSSGRRSSDRRAASKISSTESLVKFFSNASINACSLACMREKDVSIFYPSQPFVYLIIIAYFCI